MGGARASQRGGRGLTGGGGASHIGFLVDDVYAKSEAMLAAGVDFKKKPDEGSMKGLAFAKDPDGYWIEIVKRTEGAVSAPPRWLPCRCGTQCGCCRQSPGGPRSSRR